MGCCSEVWAVALGFNKGSGGLGFIRFRVLLEFCKIMMSRQASTEVYPSGARLNMKVLKKGSVFLYHFGLGFHKACKKAMRLLFLAGLGCFCCFRVVSLDP